MPVKRRKPKNRFTDMPVWQQEFLLTGKPPAEDPNINPWDVVEWEFHMVKKDDPVKTAWIEHGEDLRQDFIDAWPGCRPYAWWCFDSPEPRHRVCGIGSSKHEHLAYIAHYRFGIPESWITAREVEIYSGRALNRDGDLVHKPRREFTGIAIDPADPPQFESQAAYLDRHGLLSTKERKALPGDAFNPEIITTEDLDDE